MLTARIQVRLQRHLYVLKMYHLFLLSAGRVMTKFGTEAHRRLWGFCSYSHTCWSAAASTTWGNIQTQNYGKWHLDMLIIPVVVEKQMGLNLWAGPEMNFTSLWLHSCWSIDVLLFIYSNDCVVLFSLQGLLLFFYSIWELSRKWEINVVLSTCWMKGQILLFTVSKTGCSYRGRDIQIWK